MNADEWRDVFKEARQTKSDDFLYDDATAHASDWMCCAVGAKLINDLNLPETDYAGAERDIEKLVSNLTPWAIAAGKLFTSEINDGHYKSAEKIFESIQKAPINEIVRDGKIKSVTNEFRHLVNTQYDEVD